MRLRFDLCRVVFFNGAAVVAAAGRTFVDETLLGSTAAGVLLSSTVGLGEAMTCCSCGCALVFCCVTAFASLTGSVSPPELSQAAQPPSRARALNPFS